MAGRNNWTREQTMMAFALYRILPSGKWDKRNPTIQRLADHIRRSPSAVALKLGNLASLDENRTTKGLTNCSRLDREIWEEYAERGDALVFESAQLLASALNGPDDRPAANGDSVVEQIVAPQIVVPMFTPLVAPQYSPGFAQAFQLARAYGYYG